MQQTPELLRLLLEAGVEFVLIGGVAAIAHGSSTFTVDCDIKAFGVWLTPDDVQARGPGPR